MSDDQLAKMKARDKAMRSARDEILRRVGVWLKENGFARAGTGHFQREVGNLVCHVGFQKLRSDRGVRVMCHLSTTTDGEWSVNGPYNDPYERPNSPNGKKYWFGWSTREVDIARCAVEYCRYIDEVVRPWFDKQLAIPRKGLNRGI